MAGSDLCVVERLTFGWMRIAEALISSIAAASAAAVDLGAIQRHGANLPVSRCRRKSVRARASRARRLDARQALRDIAGCARRWARTGYSFPVGTQDATAAEPVCRFYGLPSAGLDSHFYSANVGECADVESRFSDAWVLESMNVFAVDLPDSISGECPPNMTSVYRLWNGCKDSNHRYTTDASVRQATIARGYIAEGYGPQGVAMCAPNP